MPGPASLEVEHSLRKISSTGDRGSSLAEDFSFQATLLAQSCLTDISDYRTSYITHATLVDKLLRFLSQMKRDVALKIGPMMSLLLGTMASYIYSTTQFYKKRH